MANKVRLAKEGKLILAGLFIDVGSIQGIFNFDVATESDEKNLVESDTTIKAGRMVFEIHP